MGFSNRPITFTKKTQKLTIYCLDNGVRYRESFPNADIVTDRFHVQQIVTGAVQEIRIALRKQAIKEENAEILAIREENKSLHEQLGKDYEPKIYDPPRFVNGDTKKQILARSRYLLFKPSSKWTESQGKRGS
jgi:hypothetical protein